MPKDNEVIALPQAAVLSAGVSAAVTFRDRMFRSRTVVFPDGDTAMVERSVVVASTPEHVAFLNQHADFERVGEAA
ncbi:hypothetical protein [Paraburkholderia sp. D1E]|uniref:hypothetical protein n=1 Tax=Paraburkholderia sp. D1E TaxID=3461398 RepID=UPI004046765E